MRVPHGKVYFGGPAQLYLLETIHGMGSRDQSLTSAQTHLNKYQAFLVQHDQVDFTQAAPEVSLDREQTLSFEIAQRERFPPCAYSSRVGAFH